MKCRPSKNVIAGKPRDSSHIHESLRKVHTLSTCIQPLPSAMISFSARFCMGKWGKKRPTRLPSLWISGVTTIKQCSGNQKGPGKRQHMTLGPAHMDLNFVSAAPHEALTPGLHARRAGPRHDKHVEKTWDIRTSDITIWKCVQEQGADNCLIR